MRGFGYAMGPVWYAFSGIERQRTEDSRAPRTSRSKHPVSNETEMEFMLSVTLAIALMINIALTLHVVS